MYYNGMGHLQQDGDNSLQSTFWNIYQSLQCYVTTAHLYHVLMYFEYNHLYLLNILNIKMFANILKALLSLACNTILNTVAYNWLGEKCFNYPCKVRFCFNYRSSLLYPFRFLFVCLHRIDWLIDWIAVSAIFQPS